VSAVKKILKPKICINLFLIQQWMKEFPVSYSGMYTPTAIVKKNSSCKEHAHSVYRRGCVFTHVITPTYAKR